MRVVSKKLAIVFVTNNYTPYHGGVVSSIKAYVRALRKLGHRVFIVSLDFRVVHSEPDVVRVACPVRFVYKNNHMAVPWRATRTLEYIFAKINPDIVHIHHPFLLGRAALRVCQRLQLPIVFTHHTQYEQYLHYVPLPIALIKPIVRARVRSVCQQVDAIIAPSIAIKQQVQVQGVATPITVLPSPLQEHFIKQLPMFVAKKTHNYFGLLYVGRFTQEKNILVLLDLMTQLETGRFCLYLAGYGYFQQWLIRYAYDVLKLSRRHVRFIRSPGQRRLCSLYQAADLFVFASITETQGLVLAEAMAAGTPVIALRGPGQDELIIDGFNGFLVDNREQMAERIQQVAHDRGLFERLQYGAWQTSHNFHADLLSNKLLQVYYETISGCDTKK